MNESYKKVLAGFALIGTVGLISATCENNNPTVKFFNRRSDSNHKYIQMVGATDKTHISDVESMYGMFTLTPGYRSSFKPGNIAECLFGADLSANENDCNKTIKIQGSGVADRDEKAWLADYFYLPRNYNGSFTVSPRIKTFFLDLDLFVGLDEWLCGLYFRVWGDLAHTSWNLGFCDTAELVNGTPEDHPHGYFSPANYEGALLVQEFAQYAAGKTPGQSTNIGTGAGELANPGIGTTIGITQSNLKFQPLNYARMTKCKHTKTGFADLRTELGWDFWQSDCYHLGLNLQMAAPTGNKSNPKNLFDAVVGNGNHWEVGGGLTGHYNLWRSEDAESSFSFHLDANITHLFKARQNRTFDLKNKPNSAYMLAAKFADNGTENPPNDQVAAATLPTDTIPGKQFAGEYAPVANLSTTTVDVSVGVQADIVAMFNYTCGGFGVDLGYNYWGRSCEKIDCPEKCTNIESICHTSNLNTWALKGDARMFGYNGTAFPDVIPLSATQSGANIHNGLNKQVTMALINAAGTLVDQATDDNSNIDSPFDARRVVGGGLLSNVPTSTTIIMTSSVPVFLSCKDLDFTRIKSGSHTLFGNLSYTWDRECWVPSLGVGASVEFGIHNSSCDDDLSDLGSCVSSGPCVNCAVSEWSIWLQGGVSFN